MVRGSGGQHSLPARGSGLTRQGNVQSDRAKSTADAVLPAVRWLAIFTIPFLIAAAAILWFWPEASGRLFAWPIKPPMTALLLATAYIGRHLLLRAGG